MLSESVEYTLTDSSQLLDRDSVMVLDSDISSSFWSNRGASCVETWTEVESKSLSSDSGIYSSERESLHQACCCDGERGSSGSTQGSELKRQKLESCNDTKLSRKSTEDIKRWLRDDNVTQLDLTHGLQCEKHGIVSSCPGKNIVRSCFHALPSAHTCLKSSSFNQLDSERCSQTWTIYENNVVSSSENIAQEQLLYIIELARSQHSPWLSQCLPMDAGLELLRLEGEILSVGCIKAISSCKHLRLLHLRDCRGEGFKGNTFSCALAEMGALEVVILEDIELENLALFCESLPGNVFSFTYCPGVTYRWHAQTIAERIGDETRRANQSSPILELRLQGCHFGSFECISKSFESLEALHLMDYRFRHDEMRFFSKMPNLKNLSLVGCWSSNFSERRCGLGYLPNDLSNIRALCLVDYYEDSLNSTTILSRIVTPLKNVYSLTLGFADWKNIETRCPIYADELILLTGRSGEVLEAPSKEFFSDLPMRAPYLQHLYVDFQLTNDYEFLCKFKKLRRITVYRDRNQMYFHDPAAHLSLFKHAGQTRVLQTIALKNCIQMEGLETGMSAFYHINGISTTLCLDNEYNTNLRLTTSAKIHSALHLDRYFPKRAKSLSHRFKKIIYRGTFAKF